MYVPSMLAGLPFVPELSVLLSVLAKVKLSVYTVAPRTMRMTPP
jgi:hypothetical protein